MRRFSSMALLISVAACVDTPERITGPDAVQPALSAVASNSQASGIQPGVVVVRLADPSGASSVAADHGAVVRRNLRLGIRVLQVPEGRERVVAQALSRDPRVLFAEVSVPRTLGLPCTAGDLDCQPPSDALFGRRWDLHNDGAIRNDQGSVL